MTAEQSMGHIMALDPEASILFSEWTGKWYVSARVEIGGHGFLLGVTEHRDDPATAVVAFHLRLIHLPSGKYVVTHHAQGHLERQHWAWNGNGWTDLGVPISAGIGPSPLRATTEPEG